MEDKTTNGRENKKMKRKKQIEGKIINRSENDKLKRK